LAGEPGSVLETDGLRVTPGGTRNLLISEAMKFTYRLEDPQRGIIAHFPARL
jgi:hypothetical protein